MISNAFLAPMFCHVFYDDEHVPHSLYAFTLSVGSANQPTMILMIARCYVLLQCSPCSRRVYKHEVTDDHLCRQDCLAYDFLTVLLYRDRISLICSTETYDLSIFFNTLRSRCILWLSSLYLVMMC